MNTTRVVIGVSALIAALAMTGCTAGVEISPSDPTPPAPAATTAPAPMETTSPASPTTDAVTCEAFSDVSTIVANADAGLRDGRMAAQEQQGWYWLATRVLDRLPTSGEGSVSSAVAALKAEAPAIQRGGMGTTGIGSTDWNSGVQVLYQACAAAGTETYIEMFTGG